MALASDTRSDRLHLLGVRHHGPGSARAVLTALETLDPAVVLIEGPPDADALIHFAAKEAMKPPLAVLVHAGDDPANASFYPFAVFSPEWQAMRWALAKSRRVRFIDLPCAVRLAIHAEEIKARKAAAERAEAGRAEEGAAFAGTDDPPDLGVDHEEADAPPTSADPLIPETTSEIEAGRIRRDPLAYLAEVAGYDDSEAWWNALIEQGGHGPAVFCALEEAMGALRERIDLVADWPHAERLMEARREAHMRLAIADELATSGGTVAVVCGAWHVPALRQRVAAKDDRALLKGVPKVKVTATWVPWTETRLASSAGYGAGVISPGWYAHVWEELEARAGGTADRDQRTPALSLTSAPSPTTFASRWQARVAALLRTNGRPTSTASVIEAARLSLTLAALRDLALPGIDEMREASLATLCEGDDVPFRLIEQQLVIGRRVGEIDASVPQMPLAADLARWQKRLKLKPEALDTDISLDLRSDAGLQKSLLFHRLQLIEVTWSTLQSANKSRGTFRENWRLRWEPEFSVRLAEALVHGTTVEQAAGNAAIAKATAATRLGGIASIVRQCLDAGLEQAANTAIARLQQAATVTSDLGELAGAIPPLASILRYGTAREMSLATLRQLVSSLGEAVCAGLSYGCRSLQDEAARTLLQQLAELDVAMGLIASDELMEAWRRAQGELAGDDQAHPLLRGFAVRALYDQSDLGETATAQFFSRALSPAVPPLAAANWLEGFIGTSGQLLLHDGTLRGLVDAWLSGIGEEDFTNGLPMLRRAFSSMDRSERRRLLDEVMKTRVATPMAGDALQPSAASGAAPGPGEAAAPGFTAALPLLLTILGMRPEQRPTQSEDMNT